MKTIYIPKGETVCYDRLYADRIIVNGCLRVEKSLDAKSIGGSGTIHAGKVSADTIHTGYLDACSVMCKHLFAKRVEAPEVFASKSITVSDVLSSCLVETPKLMVALCEVEELKVKEHVTVSARPQSIFGILLIATLQATVTAIFSLFRNNNAVLDADYEVVAQDEKELFQASDHPAHDAASDTISEPVPGPAAPADEELNRIVNIFKLLRDCGYTLRLVPGTPEENAPQFDAEQGRIIRPAA